MYYFIFLRVTSGKDKITSVVTDSENEGDNETENKVKTATAITDKMGGLMDFRIGNMI
jgi:hypothetical protein